MSETLVGINGFGRIGRIVFRNAYVPHLSGIVIQLTMKPPLTFA